MSYAIRVKPAKVKMICHGRQIWVGFPSDPEYTNLKNRRIFKTKEEADAVCIHGDEMVVEIKGEL